MHNIGSIDSIRRVILSGALFAQILTCQADVIILGSVGYINGLAASSAENGRTAEIH